MEVLRTTSLFAGFNDEQLEMVPKVGRERRLQPGERMVEEGATGAQSLWSVLEGQVDVLVGGEIQTSLGPETHLAAQAGPAVPRNQRPPEIFAAGDVRYGA